VSVETLKAEPLLDGLYFPEGARWHRERLWFGEIQAARVSWLEPSGRHGTAAQFESPCSGLGVLADGSLVASLMKERRLSRVDGGSHSVHADLSELGFDHINDIVSDASGRVYVDSLAYHMEWHPPRTLENGVRFHGFENKARETPHSVTDSLVLVEPDGSSRVVAEGLLGPNGLAISADGKTLVVAEWRVDRLTRFDINEDGSLSGRRVFGEAPALPDGLCADVEGGVWCASPVSGDCFRMLDGGEITSRVRPTLGTRVTACALGGTDLRTLYLTTDGSTPLGGGAIEAVEVDVPGIPI
jgi:sugar lactone lactonase YvrE